MILDEPTNGQDGETVQRIFKLIDFIKNTCILVLVSHDQRVIDKADKLIDLDLPH